MMKTLLKSSLVAGVTMAVWWLCRFLHVPPLYLASLAGWGSSCFLFSYELAGSRHRHRQGIEEKTPLQLAWMVAGLICIVTAFAVLFLWF